MTGSVALIVLSYNRPRMLREALGSASDADQVIVADDGSDFCVESLLAEFTDLPQIVVVRNPRRSPAERMATASVGRLVNDALRRVRCRYVGYLCDDDLLASGWLRRSVRFLDRHPRDHIVRGDWFRFSDGESLEAAAPCPITHDPPLTTGNFVHRLACVMPDGCGCAWSEATIAVHDAAFADDYAARHECRPVPHAGCPAGYRREHERNMLKHIVGQGYGSWVEAMFAAGSLE